MSTLSYNKQKLIASLKARKEKYVKEFEAQKEFARKELLTEIQQKIDEYTADLKAVKAGGDPEQYYKKYYRSSKIDTSAFDIAIARLEACEDTVIKLSDRSDDQILRLIA